MIKSPKLNAHSGAEAQEDSLTILILSAS